MTYIKSFISGLAFPATVLPFLYFMITLEKNPTIPLELAALFLPLAFGAWNTLYIGFIHQKHNAKFRHSTTEDFLSGFILGILLALICSFLDIPVHLGVEGQGSVLLLILLPLISALIYAYIIARLNKHLGLI